MANETKFMWPKEAKALPYETTPTTLEGPRGVRLVLDVLQVFPDDPGNGTPALVQLGGAYGSFERAVGERELDGERGTVDLDVEQVEWLEAQQRYVDEVWRQGKERDAIRKARREAGKAA